MGQAGRSIRTFFKMTAENPMLRASHCDQIYCELLRIWHLKFKPWMLQEIQRKMLVEYKFGCYDVYQNKNNLASRGCTWDIFTLLWTACGYPWVPVRVCITRESYHQHPWVISSVPVRICSTRESYPQYPWGYAVPVSHIISTRESYPQYPWGGTRVLHIVYTGWKRKVNRFYKVLILTFPMSPCFFYQFFNFIFHFVYFKIYYRGTIQFWYICKITWTSEACTPWLKADNG